MVCIGCSQGLSGAGGEVLVGLYSRGARSGGVHIAGTRSVTSKSNGDVDICSFLQCWESLSQREGLADATSGGCTTPMVALGRQLWAPVWASVPWRRGRWSFGWPWALLEWLGRRHPCLLCRRMSVRASTQGDSCDNFCPLNLPSEETGSLTLQFNEQSVSRDQQEFFLETEWRGGNNRGMRQSS